MWIYGIDASDRADEIAEVIEFLGWDYDAEHDWEKVAEELGLI